jgi:alpha-tubulin suppressor-like RCC1 family protein
VSADVGGGNTGRTINVRAFYLRNGGQEVELQVDPATIAVGIGSTAEDEISVEVLPCLTDADRMGVTGAPNACRVHLVLELRSAAGAVVSEDETTATVTMNTTGLVTLNDFTLPAGSLVVSTGAVDIALGPQPPTPVMVDVSSSSPLEAGGLSTTIQYVTGTGWLSATILSDERSLAIVPTTTTLAPGRYEAIVRVTSTWMFAPAEIRVSYTLPEPPRTVTITGTGNGTGLILVTPNGASCTSTAGQLSGICEVPAPYGSTVTLTPAPATGAEFTGWSGACSGTGECTLVMDQARAVTATFTILKRDLGVDPAGTGSGTITANPSGISCTAAAGQASGSCFAQYDHATQVTLTAAPATGSIFVGWSGTCSGTGACVVAMTEARSIVATFTLVQWPLVVTLSGEGAGSVNSAPAGIACTGTLGGMTGTCTASFPHGTTVVLTATPGATMTFAGWSGDCTGTGPCTVVMDRQREVTATVVPPTYPLTVTFAGNASGSVSFVPSRPQCLSSCVRDFPVGSTVTITAQNFAFFGVSTSLNGCTPFSSGFSTASCSVVMDGPRSVTATFRRASTMITVLGAGTGSGSVESDRSGILCAITAGVTSGSCHSDTFGLFDVMLTASPQPGSVFTGWSGSGCSAPSSTCTVPSSHVVTVTATFAVAQTGGFLANVVSGGGGHTCAIGRNGTPYCWGTVLNAGIGDGTAEPRYFPTSVLGGHAFTHIVTGRDYSCGLTAAGIAYCWGDNGTGKLGDGTTTDRLTPTPVTGSLTFSMLASGDAHACGLTPDGLAYCWGVNQFGQLGIGRTSSFGANPIEPTAVSGGMRFSAITAGRLHTCGITVAGAAFCWGANRMGQLGDGTVSDRTVPTAVSGGLAFATLVTGSGAEHTCALTATGSAYCWGLNFKGALGDGTTIDRRAPVAVSVGLQFGSLTVGELHTCGVTRAGAAYCWGGGIHGVLGNGQSSDALSPVAVAGGLIFESLDAGREHTCGTGEGGAVFCWGNVTGGRLGIGLGPPSLPTNTPRAVLNPITP